MASGRWFHLQRDFQEPYNSSTRSNPVNRPIIPSEEQSSPQVLLRGSGFRGAKYPDDPFDRFWEPFGKKDTTISKNKSPSISGIWNLPPLKVFETELTRSQSGPLELRWPLASLRHSMYYIAVYFADDRNSSAGPSRGFNVSINGITYYKNFSLTQAGAAVFATQWPLGGLTTVTLTTPPGSSFAPLINAGEIFEVMVLGGLTLTRDGLYWLNGFGISCYSNRSGKTETQSPEPSTDWNGDPCMPRQYSWSGITCSEGRRIRVITLNLTSMGLSGSVSPSIARLTALTDIWLGNNNLSGSIPELGSLKMLQTLHLENNQFTGEIPSSLESIKNLRELFLQNNNLTGPIPNSLTGKPGLYLRTSPGNHLSSPAPS
ncbi:hypothetical protein GH714_003288 [Hevea brasiliensis]|uniref:Malectin-like domain-containing protein n=1 Tax=Hevea brasiliensis TaxID=3981 RepID=A0A6A6KAF0_HEVBR|nr:hypothetical protein GH714_003288 [Hevea brasiliensis]